MLSVTEEPQQIYYKDEGGRASCLRCTIRLLDYKKSCIIDAELTLESGESVTQDILEIFTTNRKITPKKNTLELEWRVNKVSRRMDSKRFKLKLFVREDPSISCFTESTLVLSKRKRHRESSTKQAKMTTEDYLKKILRNQESILKLLRKKKPPLPELLDISWVDDYDSSLYK